MVNKNIAIGIIFDKNNKILISKRTKSQEMSGYFEFPGGKVENNESVIDALKREIFEEVGLIVLESELFIKIKNKHSKPILYLNFFIIKKYKGTAYSKEKQDIFWENITDIKNYKTLPLNDIVIKKLEQIIE